MNQIERAREIATLYLRHGWQLRRALMRAETRALLCATTGEKTSAETPHDAFEGVTLTESLVDALWFSRSSQTGREAWELRLVSDAPYALHEIFEPDEAEEDREDVRREMEARLHDYAGQS
ncbi:MAG: hypothetical protein H0V88_08400 [Pyrinomonadaceae bacterium]|nr:hypothetical protein [Pyrinomonadaceae bacterium]